MKYFAFGANMDRRHMAITAPRAVRLGTARLEHHRVIIARAGYGSLAAAPDRVTHGVLWDLDEAGAAALDRFEGVPEGVYRRSEAEVATAAGPVRAMVYLACDDRPGIAEPAYLKQILSAAREEGFPPEYLSGLAALPVRPGDPDGTWTEPTGPRP
ncbi:MAG: gamma-glutamylcyclotransferase family protein [Gemmatimonadales bacterium]